VNRLRSNSIASRWIRAAAANAEAERRIGRDDLTEALKNPAIAERLRSDVDNAERLHIVVVPKLLLNNGAVIGPLTPANLERLSDR
jgi:predicted DsbA family dithiol-disulfide isomerase